MKNQDVVIKDCSFTSIYAERPHKTYVYNFYIPTGNRPIKTLLQMYKFSDWMILKSMNTKRCSEKFVFGNWFIVMTLPEVDRYQ